MALLDEQLVDEWLNRKGFFTMRGLRAGNDEIDLLAVRMIDQIECWHVEVQVSYRPIGYVGGDNNARRRTPEEVKSGVEQWVERKFTGPRKVARRVAVLPSAQWKYIFVHGVLRDESELVHMTRLGVTPLSYKQVLTELRDAPIGNTSSSLASDIAEILRYLGSQ
jgi:hypothetical protein